MRTLAAVLIALLVGAGGGYLLFSKPKLELWTLRSRILGEGSSSAAQSQSTQDATTDSKAQRLVAAALRKGRAIERDNELYLATEAFTAEDFRRLMMDLGALKAMSEQLDGIAYETAKNLSSAMIGRWVDVDPGAALKWMPRLFELVPKDGRDFILDPLAAKQPEELLGLVSSRKKASERADIISRALAELAAKDPIKAQAWLSSCTDPADRRVAEKAIRKGIVKADPLRAIELASQISDRREGIELIASAANHAAQIGPGMIRQLATQPVKGWMLPAFLNEFATHDPELAVDLALKSDASGSEKTSSLRTAFTALADRDRELAISRLDGLTGTQRASAVAAIGSIWSAAEPEAALAWLAEKPASERDDPSSSRYGSKDALLIAFSDWASSGPDAARTWADALPPGQTRDAVQTQMARMLAANGKAAEATQILSQLGTAADPKVLGTIASAWAQRDPAAAARSGRYARRRTARPGYRQCRRHLGE